MEAQVQCPHCGVLQESSLFCKDCGKLLNIKPPLQPEAQPQAESTTAVLSYPDPPPVSYHKIPNQNIENKLASQGTRFLNLMLDTLFYYFFAFVSGLTLAFMGLGGVVLYMNEYLLGLIIFLCYYVLFESTYQKTIGKFITKTRVVTEDGQKPGFSNILGRSLCRLIPLDALSFLSSRTVGWHDSISKTRVINDN